MTIKNGTVSQLAKLDVDEIVQPQVAHDWHLDCSNVTADSLNLP